jgi:lipopolysaccharide biosynthesis glycosyltransferase
MLHSLLSQDDGTKKQIHYLHGPGLPPDDREALGEMVESNGGRISFRAIPDSACAGLPTAKFFGRVIWYRVFLPELLKDSDRVLFLDVDLIITDSLSPLWETNLQGSYVGAVTNVLPPSLGRRLVGRGFDLGKYFNSGVLLMDLGLMRRDACMAAVRDYALTHADRLIMPDQDALNAVLGENRFPLHPRWNCMTSFFVYPWSSELLGAQELQEAKSDPAIRHFEGRAKPWHYTGDRDSLRLYARHRRQTPWPNFKIEGITPVNALRRVGILNKLRRRLEGRPPFEPTGR